MSLKSVLINLYFQKNKVKISLAITCLQILETDKFCVLIKLAVDDIFIFALKVYKTSYYIFLFSD